MTRRPAAVGRGFTIIELLAAIAIMVIVAGMLFPLIGKSRAKARNVGCVNNVRQQSILLSTFLSGHGVYPLAYNSQSRTGPYPEHKSIWFLALLELDPQDNKGVTERGIWDCPGAKPPPDWPREKGYSEYGYNAFGMGPYSTDESLGLGGHFSGTAAHPGEHEIRPVRESDVADPVDTFALGDAFIGWGQRVNDGGGWLWRFPKSIPSDPVSDAESTSRSTQRHQGQANIGFCDGHVESIPFQKLFAHESDEALRRWNRDHQPHRERLVK